MISSQLDHNCKGPVSKKFRFIGMRGEGRDPIYLVSGTQFNPLQWTRQEVDRGTSRAQSRQGFAR